MVRRRRPWPEVGELVLATVMKVFDQGAYVRLDEYGGKAGYVPFGEVASTWIRNIRDFIREDQKVVLKVIRFDETRGHVDLSRRRVGDDERRLKLMEWKKAQRAEKLLEICSKGLGKTMDEAYEEAGWRLEEAFGEIYAGFEKALHEGPEALIKVGVDEKWAKAIAEAARQYIEVAKVKVAGTLKLTCLKPEGIMAIKNSLMEAMKTVEGRGDIELRIFSSGAPSYRVEVSADEYKKAEEALKKIVEKAIETIEKLGGSGSFKKG